MCVSVCVDILGCAYLLCENTVASNVREFYVCFIVSLETGHRFNDVFQTKSTHWFLYVIFRFLFIVNCFFLGSGFGSRFLFPYSFPVFFPQHTSHFNLLSLDSIFFRLLCAPIFCSSDYCVTIQKGSNDLTSHLSFTYILFGLCGAIAISMHAFSIRNNEMVKICSHFLGKPKALIADNVLLRLFRPFL